MSLELDRRLAAGLAEGFYADLISIKDRLIENKAEQPGEAEALILAGIGKSGRPRRRRPGCVRPCSRRRRS